MIEKKKAYAYITRGCELLVFEHPTAPEAGIQVPGGTIKVGEKPEVAVIREAEEETGLTGFTVNCFLGDCYRDMFDYGVAEIHHRYFYHLLYSKDCADRWRHGEGDASDGTEGFIPFDFYWVRLLEGIPDLIAEQGQMLDKLIIDSWH